MDHSRRALLLGVALAAWAAGVAEASPVGMGPMTFTPIDPGAPNWRSA